MHANTPDIEPLPLVTGHVELPFHLSVLNISPTPVVMVAVAVGLPKKSLA